MTGIAETKKNQNTIILEDAEIGIKSNLSLIEFIENNAEEFKNTSSLTDGKFEAKKFEKLAEEYPEKPTREGASIIIQQIEIANKKLSQFNQTGELSNAYPSREQFLEERREKYKKLIEITDQIKTNFNTLLNIIKSNQQTSN